MFFALIGILAGIIIGWLLPFTIPIEYTRYSAVVILGIIDALIGAVRAQLTKDHYDPWIFATGLFFNILLALGITLFGDMLGLDLYLAATVVFTFRIFRNVGIARRALFDLYLKKTHYLKNEEIK
ncbi:small basic family protein [Candidatus Peregrinibacteria bacterium]|nr:small basic family protein [Candidatus Peregrinibacteria bacterium]